MDSKEEKFIVIAELRRSQLLDLWLRNFDTDRNELVSWYDNMDSDFWKQMYKELVNANDEYADPRGWKMGFTTVLQTISNIGLKNMKELLKEAVFYKWDTLIFYLIETSKSISSDALQGCFVAICKRKKGMSALMEKFVKCGLCTKTHLQCHPLELVIESGNKNAFELFKKLHQDELAQITDKDKLILIRKAAKHGFLEALQYLHTTFNSESASPVGDEQSLLYIFCANSATTHKKKYLPALCFMLDQIKYSQEELDRALICAIQSSGFKNSKKIVKELLHRGAKVSKCPKTGVTTLHVAVESVSAEVLKLLLKSLSKFPYEKQQELLNATNPQHSHMTAIIHAAHMRIHGNSRFEPRFISMLQELIAAGADLRNNAIDEGGDLGCCCGLHYIILNYPELLPQVVKKRVNLQGYINELGEGVLHLLLRSSRRNLDLVNLAISQGCDVNMRDFKGNTPLHTAARNAHLFPPADSIRIVYTLINAGADLNAVNAEMRTPAVLCTITKLHNVMKSSPTMQNTKQQKTGAAVNIQCNHVGGDIINFVSGSFS